MPTNQFYKGKDLEIWDWAWRDENDELDEHKQDELDEHKQDELDEELGEYQSVFGKTVFLATEI